MTREEEIDYRRAFKIACDLLNGDIMFGVDSDKIFETMMDKDDFVTSSSYEEYILNHLQDLDHGQYALKMEEGSEDCISRAAAIKAMDDLEQEDIELYGCSIPEGFDGKRAIEALQSLPTVTPNQKMGRWIYKPMKGQFCSICDEQSVWKFNYCPNCGAKMGESEDKE